MENTIAKIEEIIEKAHQFKNAYFFDSPRTAHERRAYENRHSIPEIEWEEGGHTYTAYFAVSCSCSNVYASGHYTKDGSKTNLTAIKGSLRRLQAAAAR